MLYSRALIGVVVCLVITAPASADLPGDANGDHKVDLADFVILKKNFALDPLPDARADFNGDGKVDLEDFVILKKNFGAVSCGLVGEILYNGAPISDMTGVEPDFWFRNVSTDEVLEDFTVYYDNTRGAYAVDGLPAAELSVSVTFHVQGSRDTLPGNYRGSERVDLTGTAPGFRKSHDFDVSQVMHLTSPWDNELVEFATNDPNPTHVAPVTFAWDPVPGADRYLLLVYVYRDPDHPDGWGFVRSEASISGPGLSQTLDLPLSEPQEHYHAIIKAYNPGDVEIGYIMSTYTNGYGWDYRFKVVEQPSFLVATNSGIVRVMPDGSTELLCTCPSSWGVEVSADTMYACDISSAVIAAYDLGGTALSPIPLPASVGARGDFALLDDGRFAIPNSLDDRMYFLDPSGSLLHTVDILPKPDSQAQNLCCVQVGDLLIVSEDGNKKILGVNLNTYAVTVFKDLSTLPSWLGAIAYHNGSFYVASSRSILSFTATTDAVEVATLPVGNITGIVIIDGIAYVTVNFADAVYRVDLSSGYYEVFATGLDYPRDIEIAP